MCRSVCNTCMKQLTRRCGNTDRAWQGNRSAPGRIIKGLGDTRRIIRHKDKAMRRTYLLNIEGKNRDRLLEASKNDIRKYVRRERSRALPEGVDFWDFDCKFGGSEATAAAVHFATLTGLIDKAAAQGNEQFYVEVVTRHGRRTAKPPGAELAVNDGENLA